jgi:hypothetical protein
MEGEQVNMNLAKLLACFACLVACTYGLNVATEMVEAKDSRHMYLAAPCLMFGAVSIVESFRSLFAFGKEVL